MNYLLLRLLSIDKNISRNTATKVPQSAIKDRELDLKSGAEQSRTAVQTGYLPSAHSQA